MAGKKSVSVDPIIDETTLMGGIDTDQAEVEDQILAAFNADPDDVTWKIAIVRVLPEGGEGRVGTFPPKDLDGLLDRISAAQKTEQETYRIRLYKNGRIARQFQRVLITPPKDQMPVVQNPSGDIAAALGQAMERQTAMIAGLIEKIAAPRQQVVQEKSDITELVSALASLDQLRGRQEPAQTGLTPDHMFELVKQGMELARETGGGGSAPTGWMDVIKDLIKSLDVAKIAEGLAASAAKMPPQQPFAALPAMHQPRAYAPAPQPEYQSTDQYREIQTPTVRQPTAEETAPLPLPGSPEQAQQQMQMMLAANLSYLVGKAEHNSDPALYAEWVYDNVPVEMIAPIVTNPQALQIMATINPRVFEFAPWFNECIAEINNILTAERENETHAEPLNGASHVPTPPAANS